MPNLTRVAEGDMDDFVVVGLEDVPAMVGHNVQVLPDRPAKHRRREQEGDQRRQIDAIEYHHGGGAERQAEPLEDAKLHDLIHPPHVNSARVGPTPKMPPHVAELPVPHQLQQRSDQVWTALWLWRDDPEARIGPPVKIEDS